MRIIRLLSPILIPLFTYGCGGGGEPQTVAVSKQAASADCISCHIDASSPGTALAIVEEWRASVHNTLDGAGCADCHDPAPGHPNVCDSCHGGGSKPVADEVTRNPDAAGKCAKCHGLAFPNDVMIRLAPQHFGNMTASSANTSYRASYVSSRYIGNCRSCHNPHNPTGAIAISKQWAKSGLGNTLSGAFNRYEFKTMGTSQPASTTLGSYCARCHTTTGFINFVSPDANGLRFNDLRAWGVASDKTKQAINCDACHDNGKGASYSFAVRTVPAVTTYYNYSAANSPVSLKITGNPVNFPDYGLSNVCVPCHAGRGVGKVIHDAAALGLNFSSANSPGAHNRFAAGTISQLAGYEIPGRSYAAAGYQHGSIGVGNNYGTGIDGPCIGCHMQGQHSHEFLPVTLHPTTLVITGITSPTCLKCHNGSVAPAWDVASLQAKRDGFSAALAMLNLLRYQPGTATLKYPTPAGLKKNPNWDTFSPGNGANTMGAAFNYSMLVGDPAAFAHNAVYAKRLIYDSIDWLKDGQLNNDVEAAINAATLLPTSAGTVSLKNPITPAYYFTSQAPSTTTAALFAAVKADAVNYLLGGPGGGRP